ncbi:MAG: DNA repair protein RecO [Acidimicrobiales bacterium]
MSRESRYYRAHGIVLRTYKLGEADRVIVFITPERGEVRAVAKGVRKTKSKFGSRLEPLTHVSLQLYSGRGELDLVTQVETIDHFRAIREDLDRLSKAISMLEAVDQVALPDEPAPDLYRMLLGGLRTLSEGDSALVSAGFFLKLLALEGAGPQVEACVQCGESEVVAFSAIDGGLTCRDHRRGIGLSPEAVVLIQNILGGQLGAALNEPPGPATQEVSVIAISALEHFLERRMKTTSVLGG